VTDRRWLDRVLAASLAVLRRPALGSPRRLLVAGLATGSGIDFLQWFLPLSRVISPMDALLNAAGAVVAGLLVTRLRPSPPRPHSPGPARASLTPVR
jgi:hypothetical protein